MWKTVRMLLAVSVIAGMAACGNSGGDTSNPGGATRSPATTSDPALLSLNLPSNEPGVTDTEIRVASVGAVTNLLGVDYSQAPKGTQAYFDMVNASGGIYGRKLVLAEQVDDQMAKNREQILSLVSANEVFAILPITAVLFTGAEELADSGIPAYGWTINAEWAGHASLFGDKGSFICIECGSPKVPFVAGQVGAQNVAVLAYGVDQAAQCARGVQHAFDVAGGPPITYVDDAISIGATDYTVQVNKMKAQQTDFVVMCTDVNSAVNLGRELKKQDVKIPMFLQNAYEHEMLEKFSAELEGSYVTTTFAPLESDPLPPGLARYKEWIAQVPGAKLGEQSATGWLNADLFYRGLVAAGPEFTRRSVIEATNQMTDWNADGAIPSVNWTFAHDRWPEVYCDALSRVKDGRFVPAYTEPGKPFLCFPLEQPLPANPERRG
jgi:ABC-type branched-subunit amino acid transport system substrate-binding protein